MTYIPVHGINSYDICREFYNETDEGIVEVATLTKPDLLRRVPLFEHLSDTQAQALTDALEKKRYKRSEEIVKAGQKANMLFVILSGKAHVMVANSKGKEVVLAILGAGDYIGEMSLLDDLPHSASVVTDSEVDVLTLTREGFNLCISQNSQIAISVMVGLVNRLRKTNQKIASLALLSVPSRVTRFLFENAEKTENGDLVVKNKISHAALGREVGASREMVSKAMKEFEAQKLISKSDSGNLYIKERRKAARF